MVDRAGVRAALAETRRYLLSHHDPADYDRCYAPVVFGRRVRLCARCSGVYPGIAAGLAAVLAGPPAGATVAVVATLPLPALLDWARTAFTTHRGSNPVRTATGAMLGYAYGVGLILLLLRGRLVVLAIGAAYGLTAAALLVRQRRRATPDGDGDPGERRSTDADRR